MKIICSKSNLVKGVNIVSKAVPSKTTMPILECILIDATTDVIKFTANDMELGIETVVEGDIVRKGVVAIDARIFSEIVRKLPDNEVIIEVDDNLQTTISCEKANFSIASKKGDDFSYLPFVEKKETITLSQFTLKEIIRQTIFSIADNESNKLMTGELFQIENNMLKVVSLDGHRISIRKTELVNQAVNGMNRAYTPYSKFNVGAALLLKDGSYVLGCNVENASYGAAICAERNAITTAVAMGYKKGDFKKLYVMVSGDKLSTPCFICRQVISELFDKDVPLYFYSNDGKNEMFTVKELCPYPFDEMDLK
jgi:homotetrameric cytidine deaminase